MKARRESRGRSQRLLALLLVVLAPPALMLVWLGLRFLDYDRELLQKHALEGRQVAGRAAVHSLEQMLAEVEGRLPDGPVPDGVVRLTLTADGVAAQPSDRVLWLPVAPRMRNADAQPFADAEKPEFQGAPERALIVYHELSRSTQRGTRAGALLRIARVHRAAIRWDDALRAYRDLAAIRDVAILDTPLDLLARRALCATLEEAGRTRDLASEAASLESALLAGGWVLDRSGWELTAWEIERWLGRPLRAAADRRLFSAVAEILWRERQGTEGAGSTSSRRLIIADNTPVTVLGRGRSAASQALVISPAVITTWVDRLAPAAGGIGLTLLGGSGLVVAGPQPASGEAALKWQASETGLPWTVAVGAGDSSTMNAELATRRRLLSLALAAMLLLLGGGAYFLWRVVQRELAVARLQTDFVAAVSHEFRTPLTSLRHVTELLDESDDLPRERRRAFYEALGRNTERLHRLVESLLDFARMDNRRKPYDLQPLDAGLLVRDVVNAFQKDVEERGFTIELDDEADRPLVVRAEADALTNAVWNLLDNAVKYSPGGRLVRVAVHAQRSDVTVSVQDHGLGVPRSEQQEIFGRFVRGAKAGENCIKGTGIGLAMALHIVEAHGGRIDLQSEENIGSTFTIVLPRSKQPEASQLVVPPLSDRARGSKRQPRMEARS